MHGTTDSLIATTQISSMEYKFKNLGSVLKNKSAIEDRQGKAKAGFAVL